MNPRRFLPSADVAVIAVVAVVCALALALGVQSWRLRRAHRATAEQALAADTLRAHHDTSRAAALSARDSARILGDSLAARARLVLQLRQESDALDRALGQERIARQDLTATVRALRARVPASGPTDEDPESGDRQAHFDVRSPPYTVSADVRLPPPPGRGDMAVAVTVDPAAIALRLGCGDPNAAGIRAATATATGPTWLALTIGRVEQTPDLCRSPALVERSRGLPWWKRYAPHVSVGWGGTLAGGVVHYGPQVGVAIDLAGPGR
jgi:hypothetical protein